MSILCAIVDDRNPVTLFSCLFLVGRFLINWPTHSGNPNVDRRIDTVRIYAYTRNGLNAMFFIVLAGRRSMEVSLNPDHRCIECRSMDL